MLRDYIPKRIRNRLNNTPFFKSPVVWANWGILSKYLARRIQPLTPPVIILSTPRSGSSWVGEVLSLSPTALYLREPITQTYLKDASEGSPSFFEIDSNSLPVTYERSANNAFAGLPLFGKQITRKPEQWNLYKRKSKRVVIKEVNPFLLSWIIKNYKPRIIYLIRHPAAVASSFQRVGFNGKQFEVRFSQKTLEQRIPNYKEFTHSFWSDIGALQAFLIKEAVTVANVCQDFKIVRYEDLCADPLNEYKKLYDFAQLQWSDNVQQNILKRCQPKQIDDKFFSTQRNSAHEIDKWKKEVHLEKILELKQAYLSFNPPYYQDDWSQ